MASSEEKSESDDSDDQFENLDLYERYIESENQPLGGQTQRKKNEQFTIYCAICAGKHSE